MDGEGYRDGVGDHRGCSLKSGSRLSLSEFETDYCIFCLLWRVRRLPAERRTDKEGKDSIRCNGFEGQMVMMIILVISEFN